MIPIQLKQGVILAGCSPEILFVPQVAAPIYEKYGATALVITSAKDGYHSSKSAHYRGDAIDLRINNCGLKEEDLTKLTLELSTALGTDYDVILEGTHIHVEFDPRRPREVQRGALQ